MAFVQTPRARAVDLRTYCRPLDEEGSAFESREQMIKRAYVDHHRQLYKANGKKADSQELAALERLALEGKSSLAGRTQWLGGTPYAHERSCCQFNCAYSQVDSVYSLTDVAWLLLNGSGVGFSPKSGVLHGYTRPIPELVIIPSDRPKEYKGRENNEEVLPASDNDQTWTIKVGDSAAAWAKAGGKLFNFRGHAKRVVLDFSEVRGPGGRLKGYGWICNGYKPLADAFTAMHGILNDSAGNLLDEMQIMDVVNWWGSVLSSRRSAQLCQLDEHNPRIHEYERAKYRYWEKDPQRRQSNNGISFWSKPTRARIEEVLHHADECGGCPSFINASALLKKTGYGDRLNPCTPAGTLVLTRQGHQPIEDLIGKEVEVWNGREWSSVSPCVTGHNQPILRVVLSDGRSLRCTPAHEWCLFTSGQGETRKKAWELRPGDVLFPFKVPEVDDDGNVLDSFTQPKASVSGVYPDGFADTVYCFTEPKAHRGTFDGIVTGQCGETSLANRSVCNVVTNCLPRFRKRFAQLEQAVYTIARANYRQACVDMRDGVLTPEWHQTNEALRLCGVSVTGVVQADWLTDVQIRRMRNAAVAGAYSMADEWGLPRPKAITLGKPEGTGSKTFGGTDIGEIAEGIGRPLGRFIMNWINFSTHDPLVGLLESAGYRSLPSPSDPNNVLICFPVEYSNIRFDHVDGKEVNLEPATAQLDRYLRWNNLWADHNMSCTISYSPQEVKDIVGWLDSHWDDGFIAVSFLRRNDPTKTARDLGHPYLPQEVTTEGPFREYQAQLREVEWHRVSGIFEIGDEACATGSCPMK